MAATATVAAVAAGVGALGSVGGTIFGGIQGNKQLENMQQQQNLSRDQLHLQEKNSYLQGLNSVRDYEKTIADLEAQKIQYGIDIRDTESQIMSYDKWLGNYSDMYAQQVQSKQAQTDSLVFSGKETYENFLNAIGYSDAMAGATGRVGAGTSAAHTTSMLDRKLVDYAGEDRKLDEHGGLFGSQLTAANMEMQQLKVDLDFQRQEMEMNRHLASTTVDDWKQAIELTDQSIENSMKSKNELQDFIERNFNSSISPSAPGKKDNFFEAAWKKVNNAVTSGYKKAEETVKGWFK